MSNKRLQEIITEPTTDEELKECVSREMVIAKRALREGAREVGILLRDYQKTGSVWSGTLEDITKQCEQALKERLKETEMTIYEAIEILKDLRDGLDLPLMVDTEDAIKLGIEALKRVQSWRQDPVYIADFPLLGETKEADNG